MIEPSLRTIDTIDWITIIIFSSVLFVVIAKGIFYARFVNFMILPFNNKYIFLYNKKDKLLNWFHVFFTIFQVINFALFIYLARNILIRPESDPYALVFFSILGFLLLFMLLKVVLQLGNGFIFNINKAISDFIFKKLSYLNYSAMIAFLANVVLIYVIKDSKTIIYGSIFIILLINCIGWVTIIRNHQKFITSNFFYFILYLCALEISPLVLIGSFLKD